MNKHYYITLFILTFFCYFSVSTEKWERAILIPRNEEYIIRAEYRPYNGHYFV